MRWILCLLAFGWGLASAAETIPRDAYHYQRDLIRFSRSVWGLDAPVAVFAAQIHQESLWRPTARSAYAFGLAQFTPDTAKWISGAYPNELGANDPGNPTWAIQALALYDLRLFNSFSGRAECDRMAFALSAYNGGAGWVIKDRAITKKMGKDSDTYFGNVELAVDSRRPDFLRENRNYPRRILKTLQPLYTMWGRIVRC